MDREVFDMTNQNDMRLVEKIKNSYEAKAPELTKLDELKALDRRVKTPAIAFAYTYGSVGALVLGTGMCLAMEILGSIMPVGIVVGIVGIAMVSTTYSIFKKLLSRRKAKYSDEIISKSNELLNQGQ